MKRRLYPLILLLLLIACGPAPEPAASPENPVGDSGGDQGQQDATTAPTQSSATDVAEPESARETTPPNSTTEASDVPGAQASSPAEAGVVRESDHAIGASDPLVTIIEYGDFQ